jgi:hypothetical protein
MSLLRDERGSWSTARCAFWLTLLVVLALVVLDATGTTNTRAEGYTMLGTVVLALAAWAGGSRIGQYLAPQIGKVGAAIAGAAKAATAKRRLESDREHPGTEATR